MRLSHFLTWLTSDLSNERRWGIRRLRSRFGTAIEERMASESFRELVSQQRALAMSETDDDWLVFAEMNAIVFVNGFLLGRQNVTGIDLMRSDEAPSDEIVAMVAACLQLAGAMPGPLPSASPGGVS